MPQTPESDDARAVPPLDHLPHAARGTARTAAESDLLLDSSPSGSRLSNLRDGPGFLSFLAFEGHGLRVGLELSSCVLLYVVLNLLVPWAALGVTPAMGALISWFLSCSFVICLDQCVLCQPAHIYRRSYLLALHGAYDSALKLLEHIAPTSKSLIKLPASMYHALRAEFFMQSGRFSDAESELSMAENHGTDATRLFIARSRLFRMRGDTAAAEAELSSAQSILGAAPALRLEQAIQWLEDKKQLWDAKRLFRALMEESKNGARFAGENSGELARAYYNATRLWTGEAEEGLEGLSKAIEYLRAAALYTDSLRPFLAQLLLERSLYQATHKEPHAALVDMRVAISICSYRSLIVHADKVKEELRWRYSLELA